MSNKRKLKLQIHNSMNSIVEDAFSYMLFNPGKKEKEVNEIIDNAANSLDDLLARISNVPKDKKMLKSHFKALKNSWEKSFEELDHRVSKLQA
jgi:CHASE3 domain sensor protein